MGRGTPNWAVYIQLTSGAFKFVRWATEVDPVHAVEACTELYGTGLYMVQSFNRGASGPDQQAFLVEVKAPQRFVVELVVPE